MFSKKVEPASYTWTVNDAKIFARIGDLSALESTLDSIPDEDIAPQERIKLLEEAHVNLADAWVFSIKPNNGYSATNFHDLDRAVEHINTAMFLRKAAKEI